MQVSDADARLRAHEAAGRYIQVGEDRIFVREEGNRKSTPVLLVHGVPTSSYLFRYLMTYIGQHYSLAPDLPGLGLSSKRLDRDYTWSGLARTLAGIVEALDVGPVHLVLHDIGGPIGLQFAIEHPEWVRSITLLNSPLRVSRFRPRFPMNLTRGPLRHLALKVFIRPRIMHLIWRQVGIAKKYGLDRDDLLVHRALLLRDNGLETFLRIMQGFELTPEKERFFDQGLRKLEIPALVIWGTRDPMISEEHREFFVERMPDTQVHLLEAKHFLLEDHAFDMSEPMLEFWKQVDGGITEEDEGGTFGKSGVRQAARRMAAWRRLAEERAMRESAKEE